MDTRLPDHTSQHQPERQGFNLSRWAIEHANFTRFLLVLILGSGIFALTNLGQKEDPEFKFRVMIVQVLWPGASVHEMQEQVVDKIERKIQETPQLDNVQSYTHPGSAVIFVNLKGEARGREVATHFIRCARKSAMSGAPCRPVCWDHSSTMSSAIPTSRFTLSPAKASLS